MTGGNLALDLANTIDDRPTPRAEELLTDYARLLAWGRQAGALDERTARSLARIAGSRPSAARAALRRARGIRETIYRVFSAVAAERSVAPDDLDALTRELPASWTGATLERGPRGFLLTWEPREDDLDAVVRPAIRAAVDLLTSSDLGRVRECAADACSWLFLDRSKSGTRRWCDMSLCGNRAKVRRFQAKLSGGTASRS